MELMVFLIIGAFTAVPVPNRTAFAAVHGLRCACFKAGEHFRPKASISLVFNCSYMIRYFGMELKSEYKTEMSHMYLLHIGGT